MLRYPRASHCLKALNAKERERFRRHCLAGHRPWRSDCAACLDAMAFSKPHRRLARSRACALSIDVSGPHKASGAEDQDVSKPKYFMVGCYTFPLFHQDQGEGEAGEIPKDGAEDLEDEVPRDPEGAASPHKEDEVHPADWEIPEVAPPRPRPLSPSDKKTVTEENKKWADIMAACKEQKYKIVEIPMVEILPGKSTQAIVSALNRFYSRLRSWGLPIFRLHSDCAPEFTHELVKQWAGHRGIHRTTTVPENPAMNGRAERLIGRVKQQVRALLAANDCGPELWPHAVRYVVEGLQRSQLAELGHDVKPLAPFYALVKFRARTWREPVWGSRAAEGRLMAPCTDISKGYVVRVQDGTVHRLYATTLVYHGFSPPEPSPELAGSEDPVHRRDSTDHPTGRPPPKGYDDIQGVPELEVEPLGPSSGPATASSSGIVRALTTPQEDDKWPCKLSKDGAECSLGTPSPLDQQRSVKLSCCVLLALTVITYPVV